MTQGPIWGNRNGTKKSQNLKSSSELTYRNDTCAHLFTLVMKFRVVLNYETQLNETKYYETQRNILKGETKRNLL
jgi:hypothetical protein